MNSVLSVESTRLSMTLYLFLCPGMKKSRKPRKYNKKKENGVMRRRKKETTVVIRECVFVCMNSALHLTVSIKLFLCVLGDLVYNKYNRQCNKFLFFFFFPVLFITRFYFRIMSIALREENFVVINVGSKYTTAGIGMHDTNKPPNVVSNNKKIVI